MENIITVLVVPVNEKPYMKEIPNTLEAIQEIVGGYIEFVGTREGYNMIINEEGKLLDLEPNIFIYKGRDIINGQFFVCLDDGMGEMTSIDKEQAQNFLNKYVVGYKVSRIRNFVIDYEL